MTKYILIVDHENNARDFSENQLKAMAMQLNFLFYVLADVEEEKHRDLNDPNRFYASLPMPALIRDLDNFLLTYHEPIQGDTNQRQICAAAVLQVNKEIWDRLYTLYSWNYGPIARCIVILFNKGKTEAVRTIVNHCHLDWNKILLWRTFTKGLQYKKIRQHCRGRLHAPISQENANLDDDDYHDALESFDKFEDLHL